MLNINYILMASVNIRQLNQIYSQVIEKRYSAYFGNINEYYTISFRVFQKFSFTLHFQDAKHANTVLLAPPITYLNQGGLKINCIFLFDYISTI